MPAPLGGQHSMNVRDHFHLTGSALKNWLLAQSEDSLVCALLWGVGLHFLQIPGAWFWAFLALFLHFVPHLGPVLAMVGPTLAAAIGWGDWQHPFYVLMLYVAIVLVDGFLLQPYIMKRTAKVPMWASIVTPIVLGFLVPFWGVLLAPPLLAVLYAYRARLAGSPK